jgi:hypothetical protein
MDKTACQCGGELLTMTNMTVGAEDIGVPVRLLICAVCHDYLVELNQQEPELIEKTLAALGSEGFWTLLETVSECLTAVVENKKTFILGYAKTLELTLENSKESNNKSTRKEIKSKSLFMTDPIWSRRN